MSWRTHALPALMTLALGGTLSAADKGMELFESKIRPLLHDHCLKCHDGSQNKSKGGLVLDTKAGWVKGGESGKTIIPGKPEESLFYLALTYTHDDVQMPPKKEGGKISDDKIAAVKEWITMGAPDPRDGKNTKMTGLTDEARAHWTFQPVQEPPVPALKDKWARNEIDQFIVAQLQEKGLRPNPSADRATLIRRITYDMIGMPPTSEEITDFISDKSPNAYEKVVDRLLASPHYGERWGRHWLDSARYADTIGLRSNGKNYRWEDYRLRSAYTYRDYVVKAFNDDKPYNDFIMEQIAADLLPDVKSDDARLAALGFITVGRRFDNNDDTIDERIDTVTKATLGLTVSCARCHDHKFDPIPTADYYALHGIFNSVEETYDLPELQSKRSPEQIADYEKQVQDLVTKNRDTYFDTALVRVKKFQDNAEGFLRVVVVNNRSPERRELEDKYGIRSDYKDYVLRDTYSAVSMRNEHPVVGPYARLSRLKPEDFVAKAPAAIEQALKDKRWPVNPIIAEAIRDLKPQKLSEVAELYAKIFAEYAPMLDDYVKTIRTVGSPDPDIDPAVIELMTYPIKLVDADTLLTSEQQLTQFVNLPFDNNTSNKFHFAAINALRLTHPGAPAWAMTVKDKDKGRDSYIYLRGERNKKGAVVPRSFLEVLSPNHQRNAFKTEGSGRLELAQAIANKDNPLTARVAVNRVWMHHFGQGFITTPDDVGVMSEKTPHQALLDWLSARFVAEGWSMKALHRRILLSATYQQSSDSVAANESKDPDNTLFWHMNLRRLNLEAIRDSLVLLSGKMDRTMGGQPVNISEEPFSYRRSIYGYVDRFQLSDMMIQFDFADPDMPNSKRINTIVPQQALFFLNSPMVAGAARSVMARNDIGGAASDDERIAALYNLLFQRQPTENEFKIAKEFVAHMNDKAYQREKAAKTPGAPKSKIDKNKYDPIINQGTMVDRTPLKPWELYTQALICSNEFVYVN